MGTRCVHPICIAFHSTIRLLPHLPARLSWDLLDQERSRITAENFLNFPGLFFFFFSLPHKLPWVTLSHQEILRCSHEAANEKHLSVNLLPGETVAAHFSSLLLHDFIVFALGFHVFSCMKEFPAQTYRFIYAFFRLQDRLFIYTPLRVTQLWF